MPRGIYTLDSIAGLLPNSPEPEWVIKQFIDPDRREDGSIIIWVSPICRIRKPIQLLKWNKEKTPVTYPGGWLTINNLQDGCSVQNEEICFDESSEDIYFSDERSGDLLPTPSLRLPLKDLHITTDEFKSLIEQMELEKETIQKVASKEESVREKMFDPEDIIEQRKSQGVPPNEIIIELVEKYGTRREKYYGLIARKLGNYDVNINVDNRTWRKRGERLYKKVKKMKMSHRHTS